MKRNTIWKELRGDVSFVAGVVSYAVFYLLATGVLIALGLGAAAFGFYLGSP